MEYRYMPFFIPGSTLSGIYYQPWESVETRDIEYLKEMYPGTTRRIEQLIKEEWDRQEFEGSLMYDEFPDRLSVERIADRIKRKYLDESTDEIEEGWLKEMVTVMLITEMYVRRQKRRNLKKRYF